MIETFQLQDVKIHFVLVKLLGLSFTSTPASSRKKINSALIINIRNINHRKL